MAEELSRFDRFKKFAGDTADSAGQLAGEAATAAGDQVNAFVEGDEFQSFKEDAEGLAVKGRDMAEAKLDELSRKSKSMAISSMKTLNDRFPGLEDLMGLGVQNIFDGNFVDEGTQAINAIGSQLVSLEGKLTLIPSVVDGVVLDTEAAIKNARTMMARGLNFPTFTTEEQGKAVQEQLRRNFNEFKEYAAAMTPGMKKVDAAYAKSINRRKKLKGKDNSSRRGHN